MADELDEARDPLAPVDPGGTVNRETDPSQTLPQRPLPGPPRSDYEGGDYTYWLRDGTTPYRQTGPGDGDTFSENDNGWMTNPQAQDDLWPSSAEEVAGMVGGRHRLTEPVQGVAEPEGPVDEDFAGDDPQWLQDLNQLSEADSSADLPNPPQASELPAGGMTETQIRDAGMRIDVPFEAGSPAPLRYRKGAGKQTWTPPPGWDQGAPPIDPQLAADFGVPRDLQSDDERTGGSGGDTGAAAG